MLQPPRVLPSIAPPLHDGDNVHHASRVLQEHSGNRQQTDFGFSNDYEQKYPVSLLTENIFTQHNQPQQLPVPLPQQQQQVPQLFHPQPQHRHAWRFGYARSALRYPGPEDEARIRIEADRLFHRVRKSDAYAKYRHRQSKSDKNDDQKWPDHLEKAFFRGQSRCIVR